MASAWTLCLDPRPSARLRLICFPHAGGGVSTFSGWSAEIPPEVELWAVQLPGRENRIREAPARTMAEALPALTVAVGELHDRRVAFYGHSMGALLAFEVARHMQEVLDRRLVHLFVAGSRAPQLPDHRPRLAELNDSELIEELRQFDGTPEAILQEPEMLELMLPTLRADFAIVESYVWTECRPLECPITALGGRYDSYTKALELDAWRELTAGVFSRHVFPGGHFFPLSHRLSVLQRIVNTLREFLG